ncbi:RND transporter [Janthinobacterium svalbardensis]|uniref:RND transporter n=1 Tax=Janthinobacterium svalbardensis TaxID=368607 RepID=A0A290WYH9_9BURK|nr:copper-binding protein [Janthinobacterium svalbardensis]ATD61931.1 RND transporter [Janthinobacterium svalbardensis]
MNHLQKFVLAAALGFSFASAGSVAYAQQASSPAIQAAMSEGEIKKIDKDAGKLTIKHGELKNLGMPGMTMVFKVQDLAMLERVKQGDKVRFVAEKVGGALMVTAIETGK